MSPNSKIRAHLRALLEPHEVEALLDWLAAELERGAVTVTEDGEERTVRPHLPARLRVVVEETAAGARLRVTLDWEAYGHDHLVVG